MEPPTYHISDDRHPNCPNDWLWCLHCNRFFQFKHLQPDGIGDEACPFCSAGGIDVDIHPWDRFRSEGFPRSKDELRFGMECR